VQRFAEIEKLLQPRTTFVIGPDGRIEKIYGNVKAQGHASQVLAELG
jgi:peroxiredoxin Q/BCP